MTLNKKKKVKKTTKKLIKKKLKPPIKRAAQKPLAKKRAAKKSDNKKKKRPILKKTAIKKTEKNEGKLIGLITHYFPHVQAAVIKLKEPLAKGDTVKIKGHTTNITQAVNSMQIDRVDIQTAKKGDEIGLQVVSRVRQQDKVYKV